MPVTHPPRGRYVLRGRVVTMGPAGVLDDGAVLVDDGTIVDVVPAAELPAGDHGPTIRTGGTIFPGLIELHNHLSYNAMPLWDVPKPYTNNGQWRGIEPYTRRITKPSQVLGQTDGAAQALVRYTEGRALLGGTTCSQGVTLANAGGLTKFYAGLLRNPEAPDDERLPVAGTNIANPDNGGARRLPRQAERQLVLPAAPVARAPDATARGWFHRLQIDGDEWAVNERLCAIHCTALDASDLAVLADRGAAMVWSPLSNYLLYGRTADIVAAKQSGIPMCLGSDWAPSGSKNLLGELKVASLASTELGGVFSARELVEMVTINPARALKWDHLVGSIEPGKLADLVVLDGHDGDPFEQLVRARESSVALVVDRRRAAGRPAQPDAPVLGHLAHRRRLDRRDPDRTFGPPAVPRAGRRPARRPAAQHRRRHAALGDGPPARARRRGRQRARHGRRRHRRRPRHVRRRHGGERRHVPRRPRLRGRGHGRLDRRPRVRHGRRAVRVLGHRPDRARPAHRRRRPPAPAHAHQGAATCPSSSSAGSPRCTARPSPCRTRRRSSSTPGPPASSCGRRRSTCRACSPRPVS